MRFYIKQLTWLVLEIVNPIIIYNINLFMKNNLKCTKYLLVKCRNDPKTMQYFQIWW